MAEDNRPFIALGSPEDPHRPGEAEQAQTLARTVIDDPEDLRRMWTRMCRDMSDLGGVVLVVRSQLRQLATFFGRLSPSDPRLRILAFAGRVTNWHSECLVLWFNHYTVDYDGDDFLDFAVEMNTPAPERIEALYRQILADAPLLSAQLLEVAELREVYVNLMRERLDRINEDDWDYDYSRDGQLPLGRDSVNARSQWSSMRRSFRSGLDELQLRMVPVDRRHFPPEIVAALKDLNEEESILLGLWDESEQVLDQLVEEASRTRALLIRQHEADRQAERKAQRRAEREAKRLAAEAAAAAAAAAPLPKRQRDPTASLVASARKAVDQAKPADRPAALRHLREAALAAGDKDTAVWAKNQLRGVREEPDEPEIEQLEEEETEPMTAAQASAVETIDAQLSTIRWWRSANAVEWVSKSKDEDFAPIEAEANAISLNRAQTYMVSSDMKAVTFKAARDYTLGNLKTSTLEALHQYQLPCPNGFVYFGTTGFLVPGHIQSPSLFFNPGFLGDVGDDVVNIRAISWFQHGPMDLHHPTKPAPKGAATKTGPGIIITLYADRDRLSHYLAGHKRTNPCTHFLQPIAFHVWPFDRVWVPMEDLSDAAFEKIKGDHPGAYPGTQIMDPGETIGRQILWSLFHLVAEKIAAPVQEGLPRAASRRAQRGGLAIPQPGTIVVIRLRREYQPTDGTVERDETGEPWYSHRFPVSGHWRNQWYPSFGEHRAKYIFGFIKGPQDRPLIIKDKVWSLER